MVLMGSWKACWDWSGLAQAAGGASRFWVAMALATSIGVISRAASFLRIEQARML